MNIIEQLIQAVGKPKTEISSDNLFREIGFDGDSPRLGWVVPPAWEKIEETLLDINGLIEGKEEFIFVGIGGSGNGIKTLASLGEDAPIHCIDSLDPQALDAILEKIKNKEKTLVVPISKSGSTAETQLLAKTLQAWFGDTWRKNFLWLSDKEAFVKLDSSGWQGSVKRTIQVDGSSDVGGRFTCPHTLIFLLPLLIMYDRNISKIKQLFSEYVQARNRILPKAYELADTYRNEDPAFFSIVVSQKIKNAFATWVTQLIQESLGSKKEGFSVKTVVETYTQEGFLPVALDAPDKDPFLYLMLLMHFLQVFVGCFAYLKGINFVNQPCVETYKKMMRQLQDKPPAVPEKVDLTRLIKAIADRLMPEQSFIEVVLYCAPPKHIVEHLRNKITEAFPDKLLLIFLGSDWNHHSYQAASRDTTTLYVILGLERYRETAAGVPSEYLRDNIDTLRRISLATYHTIKDHAVYFSI
ncbi:MAG: hypothetical protein JXD21_08775 [Candidatus Omnitrophica bacterium]|nr:hypothetical protein [Candidatus Omnitrophota bacterium]